MNGRKDFVIMILTHGRADSQLTLKTLLDAGYDGEWLLLVDDMDEQKDDYIKNFGQEHVFVFEKSKYMRSIDTMDNFSNPNAVVYARNAAYDVAEEIGYKHFVMVDDDFTALHYRYEQNGRLLGKMISGRQLTQIIMSGIKFMASTNIKIFGFGTQSDMIGGAKSPWVQRQCRRRVMNTFICRVDRRVEFKAQWSKM